jgi:hypothetical protein
MNSQRPRPGNSESSSARSDTPSQEMRAKAGDAASKIADAARDAGGQAKQAASFTRKQPALVFGLASLAGFLAFRVLKSSPPESSMEHDPMTERFESGTEQFHGA